MALFHLLLAVGADFSALHFVHDGNPEFARAGSSFCRRLCAEHGVRLEEQPVAGRALVARGDLSWEAACRKLRYDALRGREGIFLTAHTVDDQAETVMMRLLGGAGLSGLAGVRRHRADGVVRPLLSFSRDALRDYLRARSLRWLDDPTNLSGNERALVRHQILPFLEDHKPHLQTTLATTAERLARDDDFLSGRCREWMEKATLKGGDSWLLKDVQALHPALLARFFRFVWQAVSEPSYRPRASLFEEARRLVDRGTNEGEVLFPGGWALQILGPRLWVRPSLGPADWTFPAARRGSTERLCEDAVELSPRPAADAEGWALPAGAVLRGRRPDDRFLGRCLKKRLASTGHPPWVRNRWPVLAVDDEVLAVWGLGAVERLNREPSIWVRFHPHRLRAQVMEK